MQLRRATMDDMYAMQHCNLRCLPENYNLRYYYYHILSWPQLLYVQQDYDGNVVGYVMGKMDDEEAAEKKHGHITSLAVLRSHRKLGIASRVMRATMREMDDEYKANFCSLHVRKTNDAALHLYQDTLDYRCAGVESKYYMDDEDAYHMKHYFGDQPNPGTYVDEHRHFIHKPAGGAPAGSGPAAAASGGKGAKAGAGGGGAAEKKQGKQSHQDVTAQEMRSAMEDLLGELGEGKGKGGKGAKGGKQGGGGGGAAAGKKGGKKK